MYLKSCQLSEVLKIEGFLVSYFFIDLNGIRHEGTRVICAVAACGQRSEVSHVFSYFPICYYAIMKIQALSFQIQKESMPFNTQLWQSIPKNIKQNSFKI